MPTLRTVGVFRQGSAVVNRELTRPVEQVDHRQDVPRVALVATINVATVTAPREGRRSSSDAVEKVNQVEDVDRPGRVIAVNVGWVSGERSGPRHQIVIRVDNRCDCKRCDRAGQQLGG